jgi:hypothetical protein
MRDDDLDRLLPPPTLRERRHRGLARRHRRGVVLVLDPVKRPRAS